MEELQKGFAWVTLTYEDNSVKILYTTLNKEILTRKGITLPNNNLYDFNFREYVRFDNSKIIDIAISKDKPLFEQEVLNFANRFI